MHKVDLGGLFLFFGCYCMCEKAHLCWMHVHMYAYKCKCQRTTLSTVAQVLSIFLFKVDSLTSLEFPRQGRLASWPVSSR